MKVLINGKAIISGKVTDDDLIEELDAPFSAELLKNDEGDFELLSVNSDYIPTVEEVIEELEEAELEEPIEIVIIGANSAEELIEQVASEYGEENAELLSEELGAELGGESEDGPEEEPEE